MVSEHREYLREEGFSGNKCNRYRPGRTYGHGRTLTFRIPRDRYGNFHPRMLAILRDHEECERLGGTLYTLLDRCIRGCRFEASSGCLTDVFGYGAARAGFL